MTTKGFTLMLQDLPRKKDCCGIILTQKNTLRKYEETNEMMLQFLELSEATHKVLSEKFTTHAKTLSQLKKDLENCFKRIRCLKTKLQMKYPDAFEATADAIKELQDKYDLDENERLPSYYEENTKPHTEVTLLNNESDSAIVKASDDGTHKETMESVGTGLDVGTAENFRRIDDSENVEVDETLRNKDTACKENNKNVESNETMQFDKGAENTDVERPPEMVNKSVTGKMNYTEIVES